MHPAGYAPAEAIDAKAKDLAAKQSDAMLDHVPT
jgi:hypothetical protein